MHQENEQPLCFLFEERCKSLPSHLSTQLPGGTGPSSGTHQQVWGRSSPPSQRSPGCYPPSGRCRSVEGGGRGDTGNHQFQLFFFFLLLSCRSQNTVNFNVGICSTVWGWKRCLRSGDTSESKLVPTVSCNTPRQKSFLYSVVQPWLVVRVRLSDFAACLLFRGAARSRKRKQMASES